MNPFVAKVVVVALIALVMTPNAYAQQTFSDHEAPQALPTQQARGLFLERLADVSRHFAWPLEDAQFISEAYEHFDEVRAFDDGRIIHFRAREENRLFDNYYSVLLEKRSDNPQIAIRLARGETRPLFGSAERFERFLIVMKGVRICWGFSNREIYVHERDFRFMGEEVGHCDNLLHQHGQTVQFLNFQPSLNAREINYFVEVLIGVFDDIEVVSHEQLIEY